MSKKPSIPKGTRDFAPAEVAKRQYIFSIIKKQFENFGFQPIETPSFENSETLMGKYGEEGDRLIFKILDSGDYFSKNIDEDFFDLNIVSIYISIQKIFRDITFYVFENEEFTDFESLQRIKDSLKFQNQVVYKIEEWTSVLIFKERSFGTFFQILLKDNKELIIEEVLSFVRSKGFGFKQKSKNEILERDLFIADRVQIKSLCIKFLKKLKLDYNTDLTFLTSNFLSKNISEKALRYDLTVPFARYVVQHQNEIEFPFKRYQIQPVWRADRPQKGRFREFYQCDADVVGSNSLLQEVELVQLYDAVFSQLGLKGVTIKMNNRKILSGIAEVIGASEQLIDFTVALDKLDKIGEEGVKKEMLEKGITANAIEKVQPLFHFTGSNQDKINQLSALLANSSEGLKGVEEMQFVVNQIEKLGLNHAFLTLDVTLARGLNYYTGAIFEVQAPEVAMGSIGGGGRYDDLTGIFGLKNMSGVGISFGLDRIYLVLEELNLFPPTVAQTLDVLFLNQNPEQAFVAMKTIKILRDSNIKADLYPDAAKMDKQFKYAEKRGIPLVVKDCQEDVFQVKNLQSGTQSEVSFTELIELLK